MSHRLIAVALAATLAGCANGVSTATIDHSVIPQDAGGTTILSPEGAIGYAAYSLGHPSSTENRPGNAALAVAAVDYLAGDFYTDPRFVGIPATDKIRMLQGRDEERQALGIAPGATSQQVVNGLIAAYPFYQANDFAGAARVLPISVFTLGPGRHDAGPVAPAAAGQRERGRATRPMPSKTRAASMAPAAAASDQALTRT